jgi:DNA polymerase-3 subunit delta'
MGFDTFIGNRKVVDRLKVKLREERFPHGLIFSGPEGIGKRTAALMTAKALNCADLGPADFCGLCAQCRKIDAGTHPDIQFITIEEEASEIKIAQIRESLRTLEFRPLEGKSKVFIIDPANAMKDSAANALLKGLEEPPEDSYWILLAVNVNELILTIRSRCQAYQFMPLTRDEIRRCGVTDELVIRWSQGSVGRARSLDAESLRAQREPVLELLETAAGADESRFRDMLARSAELGKPRNEFRDRVTALGVLLADLVYLDSGAGENVVNVDILKRLEKLAARLGTERLVALADHLRLIESSLKSYLNPQMLTDVFALTASPAAEKFE